jgi:DNA repair photolyase
MNPDYIRGRGAQYNPDNRFHQYHLGEEWIEGIDEKPQERPQTQVFLETPKSILSKNDSPDIPFNYSINAYQGCEHGCIYCYARNVHEYWGFGAGLDWETKIVVKPKAAEMLEQVFLKKSWKPELIMMSGNTDPYQPLERKYELTRKLLKIFYQYRHPVGIITKNSLIARDADILADLAAERLVRVYFSITTLDETLRRTMEPRTANAQKMLDAMKLLAGKGVPVGVMTGPVIPSINDHEIPAILQAASAHGAGAAGYTIARLNGAVGAVFQDWLKKNFPERADKVWNKISSIHGGKVNDSRWGTRMRGEGSYAALIDGLFKKSSAKYGLNGSLPALDYTQFRKGGNLNLF